MGLLDGLRRINNPVRGTAQVVSTSRAPDGGSSANCSMHLVVTVPGVPAFTVNDSYLVKLSKWPAPGSVLPIEADSGNPRKFKILWKEVQSWSDRGAASAQQIADRYNQTGSPSMPFGASSGTTSVTINGRAATPEEIRSFEAMTGMDLDGDGMVGGSPTSRVPFPPPFSPTDSRVDALERLAALRNSGVLTPEEFEAEKRRILKN